MKGGKKKKGEKCRRGGRERDRWQDEGKEEGMKREGSVTEKKLGKMKGRKEKKVEQCRRGGKRGKKGEYSRRDKMRGNKEKMGCIRGCKGR